MHKITRYHFLNHFHGFVCPCNPLSPAQLLINIIKCPSMHPELFLCGLRGLGVKHVHHDRHAVLLLLLLHKVNAGGDLGVHGAGHHGILHPPAFSVQMFGQDSSFIT